VRTVGVEEELLLVDATSGVPTAVAGLVLRAGDGSSAPEDAAADGMLEAELQQQQIEVGTKPCRTLAEVGQQVREWRARADELARGAGARVAALATSPAPVQPNTTPKARYQRMVNHFGLTTLEQLTCGCHVHVEVESPEVGVAVLDRIRVWLPTLLALSANSPFWQGADSGYASFRSQAWARFPSAGPTDVFGSVAAYQDRIEAMVGSGVLLDRHMVYFDARLSDSYPTVEVRVADVCLDAADTVLIAGLVRALVDTAATAAAAGAPAPTVATDLLRLATWRAGRSGVAGELLDPDTSRPRPAADVVAALLLHLEAALRANGDTETVHDGVRRVLDRGSGADFQREVFARTSSLAAVVRQAADRTSR
jgi:carboxylate-amine ligase